MMLAISELGHRMDLMRRMGEAVGGDLFEGMRRGAVGGFTLYETVTRCAACNHATACAAWLDAATPRALGEAPAFCLNRALFRRLADGQESGPAPEAAPASAG